jgi:hypothetical protein
LLVSRTSHDAFEGAPIATHRGAMTLGYLSRCLGVGRTPGKIGMDLPGETGCWTMPQEGLNKPSEAADDLTLHCRNTRHVVLHRQQQGAHILPRTLLRDCAILSNRQ